MATSQGFNKARVNYKQVARKRSQERAKRNGKAEKGKLAVKLVSGACTKKHARKVAHAHKMAAATYFEAEGRCHARVGSEVNSQGGKS
ncbi:hypothetical protein HaLaN_26401, partial [Haematococcus lacustris]